MEIGRSSDSRALQRHATDTAGSTREFLPRVNSQRRLSFGVQTPLCAIACINICTLIKDPIIVHILEFSGLWQHKPTHHAP